LQGRLFEPFQTTTPGGLGLGLSISREILARFGATLDVDPDQKKGGAVFRVAFKRGNSTDREERFFRPAPACLGAG
jgi:C4-dicarboxylate-specific signal transduction histidine kinase